MVQAFFRLSANPLVWGLLATAVVAMTPGDYYREACAALLAVLLTRIRTPRGNLDDEGNTGITRLAGRERKK